MDSWTSRSTRRPRPSRGSCSKLRTICAKRPRHRKDRGVDHVRQAQYLCREPRLGFGATQRVGGERDAARHQPAPPRTTPSPWCSTRSTIPRWSWTTVWRRSSRRTARWWSSFALSPWDFCETTGWSRRRNCPWSMNRWRWSHDGAAKHGHRLPWSLAMNQSNSPHFEGSPTGCLPSFGSWPASCSPATVLRSSSVSLGVMACRSCLAPWVSHRPGGPVRSGVFLGWRA